jgi:hypothetical protein
MLSTASQKRIAEANADNLHLALGGFLSVCEDFARRVSYPNGVRLACIRAAKDYVFAVRRLALPEIPRRRIGLSNICDRSINWIDHKNLCSTVASSGL